MGRLFEGITFSYQDEINKMRAAREAMKKEAEKEIEEARKEARKEAQKEAQKEARKEIEEAQKEVEAARRESRMMSHIYKMLIHHHSADEIKNSLIQEFGLSEKKAEEEYQKAVE